jgi:hypothetical protein
VIFIVSRPVYYYAELGGGWEIADRDVEAAANRVKESGRIIAIEKKGRLLLRELG